MILEEMIESYKAMAANVFNQSKFHAPIYIMNVNGELQIMMCDWGCQEDKQKTVDKIKDMIKVGKLKEYIFVSESWIVTLDAKKDLRSGVREYLQDHGSFADHPKRTEALFLQYSSPNKEQTFKADINRTDNDVTLSDWEDMGEEKPKKTNPLSDGRMQNIFTVACADNN